MKIAIDVRMLSPKAHGLSRYLKNILNQFFTISKEHEFFLLHNEDPVYLGKPGYIFKKLNSKKFSLMEQIEIPLILKSITPDVFHAPSIAVPLYQKFPTVITIHDLIPFIFPEYYPRQALLYLPLLKAAVKKAKIVIVSSVATKEDVNRILKVPFDKMRVIPDAAEEIFNPAAKAKEDKSVLEKFNIKRNFFLTVVNQRPYKNLKNLLEAFMKLKEKEYQLVVVGSVSEDIRRFVNNEVLSEKVILLGHISDNDLASLYRSSFAFIFPSLYEGFGLPPLEALACGAAVICSFASCLPEVMQDAGLMIDPKKQSSMTEAMEALIDNSSLRESLKAKSVKRASLFSWKNTAELTLKAYEEAIR